MDKTIVDRQEPDYTINSLEDLARISNIARASMGDLLEVDAGGVTRVDLEKAKAEGLLVGVKKLVLGEDNRLVEIEMFDRLAALDAIAKHNGLY